MIGRPRRSCEENRWWRRGCTCVHCRRKRRDWIRSRRGYYAEWSHRPEVKERNRKRDTDRRPGRKEYFSQYRADQKERLKLVADQSRQSKPGYAGRKTVMWRCELGHLNRKHRRSAAVCSVCGQPALWTAA